ncbi:MAG: hypothetical protein K8F27_07155 [Sulfuricellaceae bacterium]|nr:hypothetical protein [Sulfuricellaceae bacterium]
MQPHDKAARFFLVAQVMAALGAFAGALVLPYRFSGMAAVHIHLALALGALPLIFGAMGHFVPVLTRSRSAPLGIVLLIPFAAIGGAVAVMLFARASLVQLAWPASAVAVAAAALLGWAFRRGRRCLGSPHPGLQWYLAALVCLVAALLAVLAMNVWPEQRLALKRFHLHLNLFGFIGLTAIGTLQVLLPTAAGRLDQGAARRLRQDVLPAVLGAVLLALGAVYLPGLAWAGLALWLWVSARVAISWLTLYRDALFSWHGAAPSLAAALAGFALALLAGAAHGAGAVPSSTAGHVFVAAFLLPLVSGAVSQLLPLWLRPGSQNAWHAEVRRRLGRWGGARALLFLAGGVGLALNGPLGFAPVSAAMLLFFWGLGRAVTLRRSF